MSFKKIAFNSFTIEPLNHPKDWDIFVLPEMIKTASVKEAEENKYGGFDIQASIDKYPDHLFVKIFAIEKDIVNDNGDAFCEAELKKAAHTFIGVPVFTNHQNSEVENARGECVHSWYDDKEGGIFILARIDKVAYPSLARSIEEKYCTGTSMGASRGHDLVTMGDLSLKRVDELKKSDQVATHTGKIEKIHTICKTQDHKQLYHIKWSGKKSGLALSCEHPVLVLRGSDLHYTTKSGKKYRKNISEINKTVKPAFIKASLVKEGDHVLEILDKYVFSEYHANLDNKLAFILGVYAAEGWVSQSTVGFSFGLNDPLKGQLQEALKKRYPENNVHERKVADRNGVYITTWNPDLAEICLKHIGTGSKVKKVSNLLRNESFITQKTFLGAYLDGDGCIVQERSTKKGSSESGALQLSSASNDLLSGVRKISLNLGVPATLSRHERIASASTSTVIDNDFEYVEYMLYFTNTISDVLSGQSRKANVNKKAKQSKFDSFFYDKYVAHRVKEVEIIENDEPTYYIQVGSLNNEESDHSYILNDIATHNCSVDYSVCSVCHKKSPTADEYCDHVKNRKNRKVSGDYNCEYHDGEDAGEEPCPICGKKRSESKINHYKEQQIFEHNFGLKFIENSFVVNPACHRCGVCDILHAPNVTKKVAELKKAIAQLQMTRGNDDSKLKKVAGQDELTNLTESMSGMEKVVKSMLAQKNEISMEYVSDLVKAMADVQGIVDELSEMGYAQLPSPTVEAIGDTTPQSPDAQPAQPVQPGQQAPPPIGATTTQVTPSGISIQDMSGLGSVIKPKFSSNFINKKKDLFASSSKVRDKIKNLNANKLSRSSSVSKTYIEVFDGDPSDKEVRRIVIDKTSADGTMVIEAQGEKIIRSANVSTFPEDIQKMIDSDPEKAGKEILANKELINVMPGTKETNKTAIKETDKTAAVGNPANDSDAQQEVITEKQLSSSENADLHPRTNETWEQITEAEISGEKDADELDDTTSESPQTRRGSYDVITQGQLDSITDGYVTRWKDWPEVITEKQWTDFSRLASAKLPDDWTEIITEKQLRELLSTHRFVGPSEVITEGQFKDQDYGIKRWASAKRRI